MKSLIISKGFNKNLNTNLTTNIPTNFTPIKTLILSLFFGMLLLTAYSCKKINQDNFSSGFTSHQNINNFIQKFNIKKFNDQFGQNLTLDFKNSTPVELVYLGLPESIFKHLYGMKIQKSMVLCIL